MPALPPRRPARPGPAAAGALAPLVDLPGAGAAVDAARRACEDLRWHEAFRRRWREVRAEADVQAARASAALDGARVPLDQVRTMATSPAAGAADTAERVLVRGSLRATTLAAGWRPDLGAAGSAPLPPLPELLARLHAAAAAGWLDDADLGRVRTGDPRDLTGLGPAPSPDEVAARLALLARVTADEAPALVVAAVVHGEVLALRPFSAGNGLVARAAFRLLLASRGLDPTGAVVPEVGWSTAPNVYLASAARFATGEPHGVAGWLRTCADGVVAGAAQARVVADAVLAGRLPG